MIDLSIQHIKMKYYEDIVLEDVSFEVKTGEVIGLVGNNGCGKTSLFKVIIGAEKQLSGTVVLRSGLTLGYLAQVPTDFGELLVDDILKQPFIELQRIESELRALETQLAEHPEDESILKTYSNLQERFEIAEGYTYHVDIKRVIGAFELDELRSSTFSTLSGGEKTRVALAKILLEKPDVLLLDEPTNHLDVKMLEWLENYISGYRGAVVVISHDRYFLDQVAFKIVEIANGISRTYFGNYSFYQVEKEKQYDIQMKQYKNQQQLIKNIKAAIERFKVWGAKGDNPLLFDKVRQFQKKLDDMVMIEKPSKDLHNFDVSMDDLKKSSKRMITAKNIAKSYDQPVFSNLSFEVLRGEKVCLIGPNGSGKTTILKALFDDVTLDEGELTLAMSAKIGYLAQEIEFDDQSISLVDYVSNQAVLMQGQARNLLAKYGFRGEDVFRRISTLSGGEKSRIILMLFSQNKYNLMLLDEPTNHLDIQSKEKLEDELDDFNATIFFISHDRYFINKVATRIISFEEGSLISVDGGYDEYLVYREKMQSRTQSEVVQPKVEQVVKESTKPLAKPLNSYQLAQLELHIAQLESEIELLKIEIDNHSNHYLELIELQKKMASLEAQYDAAIKKYLNY